MLNERMLVVAAHPDDEVLGCGGTIARYVAEGWDVKCLFISDGVTARDNYEHEDMRKRNAATIDALNVLGVQAPPIVFNYPDNRLDTVPLLDIVKSIETVIDAFEPSVVFTHYGGDLNVDHSITHQAVLTACRPTPGISVKKIYSFEVMSSTEWAFDYDRNGFRPNYFIDITEYFDFKSRALDKYGDEMRSFPHSRSNEAVEALAKYRGTTCGVSFAEAYMVQRVLV